MCNLQTIWLKGLTTVEGKEIENILIYNEGDILFNCRRSEFGIFGGRFSWDKLSSIDIREVKLAKKLNLARKDNFIIKSQDKHYYSNARYDLYIHESDIKVVNKREEIYMELETRTDFIPVADLYFTYKAKYIRRTKTGEEVVEYNSTTPVSIKEGQISKHVNTDFGNQIEEMKNQFKELGIRVDESEITKILKNFKIERK